jgi:molybdenum cofactor cytidylyltransferase
MRDRLEPMSIAAIILAAGGSRRLGRPKQLLKLEGQTLLARALGQATEAGAAPVIVVLGAHREAICEAVEFGRARVVTNDQWEQGMSSSIRCGMKALDDLGDEVSGALVMSCDQPRLTVEHLRNLAEAFTSRGAPTIAASAYGGIQGVPAVFPQSVFPDMLALTGDKGAKAIIANAPCAVIALPFEGGEVDIDFPEDIAWLE